MKINIFNIADSSIIKKNEKLLKKIAYKSFLRKREKLEINIIFVNDREIKKINKKYLGKNTITDVIAFNHNIKYKLPEKYIPFGDIYICLKQAQRQAKIYDISVLSEIAVLIIHGMLHLQGYEDYNLKDRIKMSGKTLEIIKEGL